MTMPNPFATSQSETASETQVQTNITNNIINDMVNQPTAHVTEPIPQSTVPTTEAEPQPTPPVTEPTLQPTVPITETPAQQPTVAQPAAPEPAPQPTTPVTKPTPQPAAPVTQPTQQVTLTPGDILQEANNPVVPDTMGLIASFTPASFDAFVKVMNVLSDSDVIIISNSIIHQKFRFGVATIMIDLYTLFNNQGITFQILNPKKYLKLMRSMKGNNNIAIVDDPALQRYVVTNKNVKIFVPKPIDETLDQVITPDLTNCQQVGTNITIDKETAGQILAISANTENGVELLVHQNAIKGIYVPDTAIYLFEAFANENINETNVDLTLKSHSFLSTPAENYDISVYKDPTTNDHWLVQVCNTGIVNINILESLSEVSDETLI